MNPLVTKVHAKEKRWSAEYAALRRLCLASGLNEELKWGQACYDLNGSNVVLIHGFKDYCALLFMKGALLEDPKGILVQQTKNVQAARQIRFASLVEIDKQRATVKTYIKKAIAVEESGARVEMKTAAQFAVPEEFQKRLDDGPQAGRGLSCAHPRKAERLPAAFLRGETIGDSRRSRGETGPQNFERAGTRRLGGRAPRAAHATVTSVRCEAAWSALLPRQGLMRFLDFAPSG